MRTRNTMQRPKRIRSAGGLYTPGFPGNRRMRQYMRRIAEIRSRQMEEGNFDCFAKAWDGFCDQGDCAFRDECLTLSGLGPELKAGDSGRMPGASA